MAGEICAGMAGESFVGMAGGSAGMTGEAFVGMGESMVAVLHDNTASFPRRRESIKYDTSFVGWAKRSVPNALEASIPDVCQATCLNCQAAKSDVPTPAFSGYWSRLCRVFPWLCLP